MGSEGERAGFQHQILVRVWQSLFKVCSNEEDQKFEAILGYISLTVYIAPHTTSLGYMRASLKNDNKHTNKQKKIEKKRKRKRKQETTKTKKKTL